jgi:putative exporter of polyketide antibiotics
MMMVVGLHHKDKRRRTATLLVRDISRWIVLFVMLRDNVMIVMEQVNIVCYAMNLAYVTNVRVTAFVINAMVMLVTHVLHVKAVKIVICVVAADNTSFGQATGKSCI